MPDVCWGKTTRLINIAVAALRRDPLTTIAVVAKEYAAAVRIVTCIRDRAERGGLEPGCVWHSDFFRTKAMDDARLGPGAGVRALAPDRTVIGSRYRMVVIDGLHDDAGISSWLVEHVVPRACADAVWVDWGVMQPEDGIGKTPEEDADVYERMFAPIRYTPSDMDRARKMLVPIDGWKPRTNLDAINDGVPEGDRLAAFFASSSVEEHERHTRDLRELHAFAAHVRQDDRRIKAEKELPSIIARLADGLAVDVPGRMEARVRAHFGPSVCSKAMERTCREGALGQLIGGMRFDRAKADAWRASLTTCQANECDMADAAFREAVEDGSLAFSPFI